MKILIVGGTGMLGHRLWMDLGHKHQVWGTVRGQVPISPVIIFALGSMPSIFRASGVSLSQYSLK